MNRATRQRIVLGMGVYVALELHQSVQGEDDFYVSLLNLRGGDFHERVGEFSLERYSKPLTSSGIDHTQARAIAVNCR